MHPPLASPPRVLASSRSPYRLPFQAASGFTFLVVAAVSLLFAPGVAPSAEPPPTAGLTPDQRSAFNDYGRSSDQALEKLVAVVKKGSTGSEGQWRALCKEPQKLLDDLNRDKFITPSLQKWFADEVLAWERMEEVGAEIAGTNELLLHHLDLVEQDTIRSEAEIKCLSSDIKACMDSWFKSTNDKLTQASDAGKNVLVVEQALKTESPADELIVPFRDFRKKANLVLFSLARLEGVENTLRRVGDNIVRRKLKFLKANESRVRSHKDNLAKLVSEKIDPDGRGVFAEVEKKIEEAAQDNLAQYQEATEAWEKLNGTLTTNVQEFFTAHVLPAAKMITIAFVDQNFFLVPAVKLETLAKPDQALGALADHVAEAVKTAVGRVTGKIHEWRANTIEDAQDQLTNLENHDYPEALQKLEDERENKRREIRLALQDRLEEPAEEMEERLKDLRALEPDQREVRRQLEEAIAKLESQMSVMRAASTQEMEVLDRRWYAPAVQKAEKSFQEVKAALEKQIKATDGVRRAAQ